MYKQWNVKTTELNIGGIKNTVSIVSMINGGYEGNNKIDRGIIDEIIEVIKEHKIIDPITT